MPVSNFLSVTFDDLNAFAFIKSLYPGTLHTPNIDRVMGMGTTFENAYSQVAVCNASRASALSGLNPGLTGVHHNYDLWSDQIAPELTLPGVLLGAGFDTSLIGKVFHVGSESAEISAAIANFEHALGMNGRFEELAEDNPLPYGPSAHPLVNP